MSRDLPLAQPLERPVSNDPIERVIWYHNRTKHHFNRYARSLGFLDWANQPDPFRRFAGAELVPLPLLKPGDDPTSPAYEAIYEAEAVPSQPVTIRTLSRFFEFALALSAWKRAGDSEWALRANPSSGNLHPTEGYVILPPIEALELVPGLYHYAPKEHGLEFRAAFAPALLTKLLSPFPTQSFLFGLTSVHWREAWKYGERAFRYCNHDVGHAIGTARVAAATLGWRMVLLDGVEQNTVARLLGTHRTDDYADVEPEHPDCLAVLWPGDTDNRQASVVDRSNRTRIPLYVAPDLVKGLSEEGQWYGKANGLSRDHAVHWDIIDDAAEASWKATAEQVSMPLSAPATVLSETLNTSRTTCDAGAMIRQRRSAVAFDGQTSITAATFFRMLERLVPRAERPQMTRPMPWDLWPYEPAVHLMIFVHRVEGLRPGLYFLLRDPGRLALVRQALNSELEWTPAPHRPEGLPLYWLLEGDARRLAAQVSCHQDIAGDSAFSLGMLAEFEGRLRSAGAWCYPRLFWETGLIGQVLYLEAEAAGVRATGIGCFFDDAVHEIVAITDLSLQSLYHFTIGGPVEDRRLLTLPPYGHLSRPPSIQP
jgi:SagB-type dehydrogenase family enzyme